MKNKRIITVATTGAWTTKKDNPNIPITPAEIAADVYECWKAGAAVCHIHVRDEWYHEYRKICGNCKTHQGKM